MNLRRYFAAGLALVLVWTLVPSADAGAQGAWQRPPSADVTVFAAGMAEATAEAASVALPGAASQMVAAESAASGRQWSSGEAAPPVMWVTETVESSQCFFANVSLTLGPGDAPQISYFGSADEALKYARRSGAGWTYSVVDVATAVDSSIALDSAGRPHIAYRDGNTNSLKYASWDGTRWNVETVAPSDEGWEASLQIDAADVPHIAYLGIEDNPNPALSGSQRPKYAHRSGSTWDISLIQGQGSASALSLALDSLGRPQVSFDWEWDILHAVYSDTVWLTDTVDTKALSGFALGNDVSIVLDAADQPHVSYDMWVSMGMSGRGPAGLRYAHRLGAGWAHETVGTPSPVGFFNSLALDGDGHPHIVFYDQAHQALKYAHRDGAMWLMEEIDVPVQIEGGTSLALDSDGQPRVAYCETGGGTVKYARRVVLSDHAYLPVVRSGKAVVAAGEIAYLVAPEDGSFYHIYGMNTDGSNAVRLSTITEVAGFPVWSRDGRRIAFDSLATPSWDIYAMDANGANQVNLTQTPGVVDSSPSWSPDGSKIVFSSNRDTGDNRHNIYAMNADGSNVVKLTDAAAGPWVDHYLPSWSPDGAKIAVEAVTAQQKHAIYIMNADGSNPVTVTSAAYDFPEGEANAVMWIGWPPAWSPDSRRIAFGSDGDGNDEVYVVNSDGSGLANLTNRPSADKRPAWSPDGTKIAFVSDRDSGAGSSDIYVMDAGGGGVVRLTDHAAIDSLPSWSPEGSKLVFASDRDGRRAVYVMNADGSGEVKISTTPLYATLPAWSP